MLVRGRRLGGLLSLAVSYGTFLLLSLLLPRVPPVWLQGLAIGPAVLVNNFSISYWPLVYTLFWLQNKPWGFAPAGTTRPMWCCIWRRPRCSGSF